MTILLYKLFYRSYIMKNFLKTYKSVIILLVAIIIGTIVGLIFKEKAAILSPFGDIFINLMFIIIIPLVFLSITTAIAKMKQPKRLGKIMVITVIMFLLTGLIALLVGVFSTYKVKLIETKDSETIKNSLVSVEEQEQKDKKEDESILQIVANTLTVNDFSKLLSKSNIIAYNIEIESNCNLVCTSRTWLLFCNYGWKVW